MIGESGNRLPGKIVLHAEKSTPPDESSDGQEDDADDGGRDAVLEADVGYCGVMPGHEAR
jgi:hypothetical protein